MTSRAQWHLGMDIGGTKCAVTLGCHDAQQMTILSKRHFDTATAATPQQTIELLATLAGDLLNEHRTDITSIGISCGGPLDSQQGIILGPPNLPGWDHVPIVQEIEKRLKTSTFLQNDANASALAEWRWGAGQQCQNMIFLTFGTGMGAGLILNGKLYSGTNDLAGEVGHIRLTEHGPMGYGKHGSFEGYCSGGGLARAASDTGLSLTAEQVFDLAAAGDVTCKDLVKQMGQQLGRGLAILIDILNPQKIILGSIYPRQMTVLTDLFLQTLREEALQRALTVCEILPAKLGESIGDYAALAVARNGEW
jgi:glucokinase